MPDTVHYVAGLLFDNAEYGVAAVALILKDHGPMVVVNKWNAIGGKIKPTETSLQAMEREFYEEAGVRVSSWKLFMQLRGEGWTVDFYKAFSRRLLQCAHTAEREEVRLFSITCLPRVAPGISWIIQMALQRDDCVYTVTEGRRV
jgi:8-oxo-dGTP pyrophosphatase MutT (NUDIX family)